MAAAVAIRDALQRMGFSANAALAVTNEQGIDDMDELGVLTDTEVENLCKVVRRPGGANTAGVANPGHAVSLRAENNLKLACYS